MMSLFSPVSYRDLRLRRVSPQRSLTAAPMKATSGLLLLVVTNGSSREATAHCS
jgi:hypothetical protein